MRLIENPVSTTGTSESHGTVVGAAIDVSVIPLEGATAYIVSSLDPTRSGTGGTAMGTVEVSHDGVAWSTAMGYGYDGGAYGLTAFSFDMTSGDYVPFRFACSAKFLRLNFTALAEGEVVTLTLCYPGGN
jgi:hypothetical protein